MVHTSHIIAVHINNTTIEVDTNYITKVVDISQITDTVGTNHITVMVDTSHIAAEYTSHIAVEHTSHITTVIDTRVVLQKLPRLSDMHFSQVLNKLEKNFFHGFIKYHLALHFI